ncbi:hypothetical protein HC891_17770 [Candidatus Gracilibacteria bacterium]|nr:hypothetical protein [Candidatus Gracilibacteria bacterium]
MTIQLSWRTWCMLVALGVAIYVAIAFLPLIGSVLVLLFLTGLLAMLIYPLARRSKGAASGAISPFPASWCSSRGFC